MPLWATRVERDHEVVRIGNVAPMQAEAVHPRIALPAAGEEPAIARRRVPHGEARQPPRLARIPPVDLRGREGCLAVVDVPEGNRPDVEPVRHAQTYNGLVPRAPWRVDDVQVGAVVVRSSQRHAPTIAGHVSRTAPRPVPASAYRPATIGV